MLSIENSVVVLAAADTGDSSHERSNGVKEKDDADHNGGDGDGPRGEEHTAIVPSWHSA